MDCWREPHGRRPFGLPGVHVWLSVMPDGWSGEGAVLSEDERSRAARFRMALDRDHYIFHHTAVRLILAEYAGVSPETLVIVPGEGGKPALEKPGLPWRFNLSHCGPVSLCAVSAECEVGVDIERVRPMPAGLQIARRFFTRDETEALCRFQGEARDLAFFACWTRKEAFLKATGAGLGRDLESFAVPVDPGETGPWEIEPGWSLAALPAPAGYACALAAEGLLGPVHTWRRPAL